MMTTRQPAAMDMIGMRQALSEGRTTPAALVEQAIARAEATNPSLNFIAWRNFDRARAAASAPHDGPLSGVPTLIKDMLPEGAEAFKGAMGKEVVVTFTEAGAYGIKCAPHLGMGMVALVVVGDAPANLEAIQAVKVPNKAKERFEAIYAELAQ